MPRPNEPNRSDLSRIEPGRRDSAPGLPLDPDAPDQPLHLRAAPLGLVLVGGVLGALARDGLSLAADTGTGSWPWATFAANMLGAFVLGALLESLVRLGADDGWRQQLRLLVGTGFCGGLTTYSTFAVEVDLLTRDGAAGLAAGYLGASLVGGFVTTLAGIALAARWHRATTVADGTQS